MREADDEDLAALRDLEREANLVALGHVFPPDRYPFPDDDVLARWRIVLHDPEVTTLVEDAEDGGGLVLFCAYDESTVRHLAVRPDRWGQGLASRAMDVALQAMDRSGTTSASLWCLVENHRARRVYEYLGWQPTEDTREAPWPPYPQEMRYQRLIVQSER